MKKLMLLISLCGAMLAQNNPITGSLTSASTDCSGAQSSCVAMTLSPTAGAATVKLAGTFSATLQFEVSSDNRSTWTSVSASPLPSGAGVTSATSTGTWRINGAGFTDVRVRCSTWASGTVTVTMNYGSGSASIGAGGGASASFDTIQSGTNTSAAMVVSTGASLAASGSGTIAATSVPFSGAAAGTNAGALVIGTGGSLATSGTGTITATATALPSPTANTLMKEDAGGNLVKTSIIDDGSAVNATETIGTTGEFSIGATATVGAMHWAANVGVVSGVTGAAGCNFFGTGVTCAFDSSGNIGTSGSWNAPTFGNATNTAVTLQGGKDATTTGAVGTLLAKGEDVTGGSTASLAGGAVTLRGGDNASTGNSNAGGAATVRGGDATGGTGTTDTAGNVTVRGGNCTSTTGSCTPGTMTVQSGGFSAAFTNGAAVDLVLAGGQGTGNGTPAHVKIQAPALGLSSASTAQPLITQFTTHKKAGSTTSATATTLFNIASATNNGWGVEILVHVDLISSTPNVCSTTEHFSLSGTNNNGSFGTVNIVAGTISTLCSAGTLTLAVSATAANPSVISVTPTWATIASITSATITVQIYNVSQQEITLL